ncbi:protein trichome birefringence-like 12 isoform X2 [Prunus dulcis]|uniref:protein trichome birefringence-like 12 isoform X2 n=1 Tax=Prunus dulcis TaxID=3755 RepID=UPI0014838381|nr:protein trichome birefringence-like 12 isoform X2 [Prunus dulcis]
MAPKLLSPLFPWLILLTLLLLFIYSSLLPFHTPSPPFPQHKKIPTLPSCNLFNGRWVQDPNRRPMYDETCPFHRNAWNCLRNKRDNMGTINSWKWVPQDCVLHRIDAVRFLGLMRDRNIGFVGDSLNENFLVSFLCILRVADLGAKKWKRKGAWRGAYFPKFNVTVGYHRAVLLARYEWSSDKFPKETPLSFYRAGKPILPPLDILDGFKVVLENMVSYIQNKLPQKTLKLWRLQSPRHFYGGEWNQNGSCLFNKPLEEQQLDLWFDPSNNGPNKEERLLNHLIEDTLQRTDIQLLNLTYLSEFRADAHPAIWLGQKDAVAIWGQDCMHWCLPGVPDTWVDILTELIRIGLEIG